MKKGILMTSLVLLFVGLTACGSTSEKKSESKGSSKIEHAASFSSSNSDESLEKGSLSDSTSTESVSSESHSDESNSSEAEFKQLLSDVAYNKEYLTEEQTKELKESYKHTLSKEQYQEFLKVLEE